MGDPLRSESTRTETRTSNGPTAGGVTSLMYTEDKAELLWKAHEQAHELEQKALTVALTASDAQLRVIQDYIVKYIDSELRKLFADHVNLLEQIRKDWTHHNQVHGDHSESHNREHKQTQDAIDKAEKTALQLSQTLGADVQRTNLALGTLVSKDQLATEAKASDARIALLERGASVVVGRDAGISTAWAIVISVIFVVVAVGGFALGLAR